MTPVLWVFLSLLGALVAYGFHPIQRWRYRHIPGPRPKWLVGNLLELVRGGQEEVMRRWGQQYGPVFCLWMGAIPVVMTEDPEAARKVLVLGSRHPIFNLHVGEEARFESYNIVFNNGEAWRIARNAWHPFFTRESLRRHGRLMLDSADRLCAVLRGAAEAGTEVDIWRKAGLMTLDVVGTTAFGVDFNTLAGSAKDGSDRHLRSVHTPAEKLVDTVRTLFEVFGLANLYFGLLFLVPPLGPVIRWLANHLPNAAFKKELAARATLKSVSAELIQQARAEVAPASEATPAATHGRSAASRKPAVDPTSFMALMLRSTDKAINGQPLGDLWVTNQANTFTLVGYETTANALAYSIYLLALNPDKEAQLLAEIDAFSAAGHSLAALAGGAPGSGKEAQLELLDVQAAFPYAHAVLQEALRLYPPAIAAVRQPKGPMSICGYDVPLGAALQVSIYGMHRSERYWRDPLAFKPERFLAGTSEAAEVVPGAHMPFGDGARKCIGYRFALMEAILVMVRLYQQYTFRLLPGQVPLKVQALLTMSPVGGIRVTVHPRGRYREE